MSKADFQYVAMDTYNQYVEANKTTDENGDVSDVVSQRFRYMRYVDEADIRKTTDFNRMVTDLIDMVADDKRSMKVLARALKEEIFNYLAEGGLSIKTFEVARYCGDPNIMEQNYRSLRTVESCAGYGMDLLRIQVAYLVEVFENIINEQYAAWRVQEDLVA